MRAMLKNTLFCIAVGLSVTKTQADSLPKSEIYLGFGAFSSKYLAKGVHFVSLDDYLDDKWSGGPSHVPDDDIKGKLITKVAYGYRVQDNWFVTLSALSQGYQDQSRKGKIKAGLIGLKYEYNQKDGFGMSSGAALGQAKLTYENNDPQDKSTAFHINALDIRFGSQSFSGHLAFGYGFEGLIQGGIAARF